jgi:hypothetical protein
MALRPELPHGSPVPGAGSSWKQHDQLRKPCRQVFGLAAPPLPLLPHWSGPPAACLQRPSRFLFVQSARNSRRRPEPMNTINFIAAAAIEKSNKQRCNVAGSTAPTPANQRRSRRPVVPSPPDCTGSRKSLRKGLARQAETVGQVAYCPVEPCEHDDFDHGHLRQVPAQSVPCLVSQTGRRM